MIPGRESGPRPRTRAGAACPGVALALSVWLLGGCATRGLPEGRPLDDPAALADRARSGSGPGEPQRLRFEWQYADERGPVHGDGVLRYSPPDSLRLDLFGPGDGSMSVSLTGGELRSTGQVEDVRLPSSTFLYATAGIFRPERDSPERGFRSGEDRVLVYAGSGGSQILYSFRGDLLVEVREVREGTWLRRLRVEWNDRVWPEGAEYRDRSEGSRARWDLEEARRVGEPFAREIYELPRSLPR